MCCCPDCVHHIDVSSNSNSPALRMLQTAAARDSYKQKGGKVRLRCMRGGYLAAQWHVRDDIAASINDMAFPSCCAEQ